MNTIEIRVTAAQAGRRIGSILRYDFGVSKTLLARLKHTPGAVTADGVPVRMTDRAGEGMLLHVDFPEREAAPEALGAETSALSVLYEDEALLILNKPAGVKTHPAYGGDYSETVAAAVSAHLGGAAFHPVTRLDKGTSGAMLIAKSGYVHSLLQRLLHTDALVREYLAVASGTLTGAGVIDLPLMREEGSARRVLAPKDATNSITAVTYYETLSNFALDGAEMSLLRLRLGTGRTHQIRAHLAAVGHPLLGDSFYGGPSSPRIGRPALHSWRISLVHPVTRESLVITAPLPEDMNLVMENGKWIMDNWPEGTV